jgi:hypothetical protein
MNEGIGSVKIKINWLFFTTYFVALTHFIVL